MPHRSHLTSSLLIATVMLIPASLVFGYSSGAIPGRGGVPFNVTTSTPACGTCHGSGRPGDNGPVTATITGVASIQVASDALFGLQISSQVPGNRGGFALTSDGGTLTPLGNTQSANTGRTLAHTSSASRSWSFKFRSATTGLVKWHMVGQTVNGNGKNSGDSYGFYGPDPSVPGTPFRVFVNDSQVFAYGRSCAGDRGFEPLLGAAKNATRGQSFPVEIHNVPAGTVAIGIFGVSNTAYGPFQLPLALAPFGGGGCQLNASMDVMLPVATSGAGPGGGSATFPWVIPNLALLKGVSVYCSALVVDPAANQLGLTTSMGLRAVIQ